MDGDVVPLPTVNPAPAEPDIDELPVMLLEEETRPGELIHEGDRFSNVKIAAAFDKAIADMKKDGSYDLIVSKHYIYIKKPAQ